jgi:hypothetical protein
VERAAGGSRSSTVAYVREKEVLVFLCDGGVMLEEYHFLPDRLASKRFVLDLRLGIGWPMVRRMIRNSSPYWQKLRSRRLGRCDAQVTGSTSTFCLVIAQLLFLV